MWLVTVDHPDYLWISITNMLLDVLDYVSSDSLVNYCTGLLLALQYTRCFSLLTRPSRADRSTVADHEAAFLPLGSRSLMHRPAKRHTLPPTRRRPA